MYFLNKLFQSHPICAPWLSWSHLDDTKVYNFFNLKDILKKKILNKHPTSKKRIIQLFVIFLNEESIHKSRLMFLKHSVKCKFLGHTIVIFAGDVVT